MISRPVAALFQSAKQVPNLVRGARSSKSKRIRPVPGELRRRPGDTTQRRGEDSPAFLEHFSGDVKKRLGNSVFY